MSQMRGKARQRVKSRYAGFCDPTGARTNRRPRYSDYRIVEFERDSLEASPDDIAAYRERQQQQPRQ